VGFVEDTLKGFKRRLRSSQLKLIVISPILGQHPLVAGARNISWTNSRVLAMQTLTERESEMRPPRKRLLFSLPSMEAAAGG